MPRDFYELPQTKKSDQERKKHRSKNMKVLFLFENWMEKGENSFVLLGFGKNLGQRILL